MSATEIEEACPFLLPCGHGRCGVLHALADPKLVDVAFRYHAEQWCASNLYARCPVYRHIQRLAAQANGYLQSEKDERNAAIQGRWNTSDVGVSNGYP